MVAPAVAAAGISAVGSLLGGLFGGGGAKKAAKIQQQTVREQIAANERNRQYLTGLSQPTLDRGEAAGVTYSGLLGLGDAAASKAGLDTFRGSTGYQDLVDTGLGAINSNAYARGLGDSGATLKALQAKGMSLADQNQGQYRASLMDLMQLGSQAIGTIGGVSTSTTNANNAALQSGADANSNAALASSAAWQKVISNLTNIGASAAGGNFASSYGGGSAGGGLPYYPQGAPYVPPGYYSGGLNPRFG